MKVLVVDDDEIQLEFAEIALNSAGFTDVTALTSATEALAAAGANEAKFDVVLLDIMMPEFDGIEACRAMRRTASTQDATILMMTAMSDRRYIDNAFAAGATDYIIKPFDEIDLKHRLSAATQRRRPKTGEFSGEIGPLFVGEDLGFDSHAEITHHTALMAYLETLDRGRASMSMATVFYVPGKNADFLSMPADDHLSIVSDLSGLIKANLEGTSFVLSYCGDATFVCFTRLGDPVISGSLARRLETAAIETVGMPLAMRRGPGAQSCSPRSAMDLVFRAVELVRSASSDPSPGPKRPRSISHIPDIFSH